MQHQEQQQHDDMPYNEHNVLFDHRTVTEIISKYCPSFTIGNIDIYRTSMVHKSYCTRKNENFVEGNVKCPPSCLPLQEESNERLEFLGDAVLNLIIGNYLYDRYCDSDEGFLTRIRTKLVNGTMLAELNQHASLPRFSIISKQIEENNGRLNKKILEDCFEGFLGAIFLDAQSQGKNALDVASQWVIGLIEDNLDFTELIKQNNNYKDAFLKYFQHNFNVLPKFIELSTDATNNGKIFRVVIKDNNNTIIGTGTGATKKSSENDAAKNAMLYFGVNLA